MRLEAHKQALYELRFSPMCKPATEVANLTQLESHTVRARTMMFWRIAQGIIDWGPREVELTYESTLDSISGAFDVFHYPIHLYMLDARADIWEAGLAPNYVTAAIEASAGQALEMPLESETILLAGEIAQLGDDALLQSVSAALDAAGVEAPAWVVPSGALAYALGAWDVAKMQAIKITEALESGGVKTVVADGPETAWALTRIYPALGVGLPEGVTVKLLSEVLAGGMEPPSQDLGKIFVHDSRSAYLIATEEPLYTVVLPGYTQDESTFGGGPVYEAPRKLLDAMGAERVWGPWTRALAKTSGADDGLWLTHPKLAAGLAAQRLDHATALGATMVATDSPLAASFLSKHAGEHHVGVKLLAELLA
jgi:Fe-S oxidoreductase